VRLIAVDSLGPDDLRAWGVLAERAVEPNPFFEPTLVVDAVRTLDVGGVGLMVAEDPTGGDWQGAFPVLVSRRLGLLRIAEIWRHPYSYLGTPLVAAGAEAPFARALADSLRKREHFDHLFVRRLSLGPVHGAILDAVATAGLEVVFERRYERGAYEGRPADRQLDWIKSKRRSEMRRQRRKLGETVGAEVEVVELPPSPETVEAFLAMESAGWKGEAGSALASSADSTTLFHRTCAAFAAAGRIQFRALRAGERNLAMSCDLAAGDTLFGFKSTYDESLHRFSPGVQLQAENFTNFDETRPETLFDSCAEPDNEMINALWPDRRGIATTILGPSGIRGAFSRRVLERAYARGRAEG
jgi:CelD/BcsL family acetyltransferase involved in cellulose biosynthesis